MDIPHELRDEFPQEIKGIFCDDISEFESSHPSQAVPSLWGIPSLHKYMRHPRGLARRHGVSDIQFSEFQPQTRAFHATARSKLHETGLRAAPTALLRAPLRGGPRPPSWYRDGAGASI